MLEIKRGDKASLEETLELITATRAVYREIIRSAKK